MSAAAWRILGIARTTDRSAIRRAYAERLRAMDLDADPDGYQRLRDARDHALASAAGAETLPEPPAEPARSGGDDPVVGLQGSLITAPTLNRGSGDVSVTIDAVEAPLRVNPAGPDTGVGSDLRLPDAIVAAPMLDRAIDGSDLSMMPEGAIAAAYDRFAALLLPDGHSSPWALTDEELAEAQASIATFMRDPRLEELSFRDHAANWVAAVAADSIPRGDPVLATLADRFGWRAQAGLLGEAPATARVSERLAALAYVAAVSQRGHALHGAWKELTTPASERSRRGGVRRSKVDALLNDVRLNHPEVEGWFDGYRVGLWENRAVTGPNRWVWAGMLAFLFLRLLTALGDDSVGPLPSDPPTITGEQPVAGLSDPLSEMDRNLTSTLLTLGDGYTAERVKRDNPALYAALAAMWRRSKAANGRVADLDRAIYAYFDEHRLRAAQVAPLALAVDLQRNALDQLEDVHRRFGDAGCATWLGRPGAPTPHASPELERARYLLLNRAVFAVAPEKLPKRVKTTYRIPGDVMALLGVRLGWHRERLTAALDGSSEAADVCRAGSTLRTMLLEKPTADDLQLLRQI